MSDMYKYINERKGKGIWHLCDGCNQLTGECNGSPIFMSDLHEVPPPNNDAVIICDKFENKDYLKSNNNKKVLDERRLWVLIGGVSNCGKTLLVNHIKSLIPNSTIFDPSQLWTKSRLKCLSNFGLLIVDDANEITDHQLKILKDLSKKEKKFEKDIIDEISEATGISIDILEKPTQLDVMDEYIKSRDKDHHAPV